MGEVVKQINNIRIEKFKKEHCCQKIYPNGNVRKIRKKESTCYRAISPKGGSLFEDKKFKRVKEFALNCTLFTKRSIA